MHIKLLLGSIPTFALSVPVLQVSVQVAALHAFCFGVNVHLDLVPFSIHFISFSHAVLMLLSHICISLLSWIVWSPRYRANA